MHASLRVYLDHAEKQAHALAELVWEAAHYACARLTCDLPEDVAHEIADRKLAETLSTLAGNAEQQIRFLAETLGEAEATRRLELAFGKPQAA